MQRHFESLYSQRELEDFRHKVKFAEIRLEFGNTHKIVESRFAKESCKHKCKIYVKAFKNEFRMDKLVDKVVFRLHPSFKNPEQEITKAPFSVECRVWGYFDVAIEVYFSDWTGLGVVVLDHELCIEAKGSKSKQTIELSRGILPEKFFKGPGAEEHEMIIRREKQLGTANWRMVNLHSCEALDQAVKNQKRLN